jgi:hypothetical protein
MSDGYLGKNKRIHLSMHDKEVIDIVKEKTKNLNKIYISKPRILASGNLAATQYRVAFRGKLHEELIKNGWFYGAKTGKEFIPYDVDNEEKFWHFLRGLTDGDGTIYISKEGTLRFKIVSASKEFLEKLSEKIYKYCNIVVYIHKTAKIFAMGAGHHKSVIVCNKMYSNSDGIRMERKKAKYDQCKDTELVFKPQVGYKCTELDCCGDAYLHNLCKHHYYIRYKKQKSYNWYLLHKKDKNRVSKEKYYSVSPEDRKKKRGENYLKNRDKIRSYLNKYYKDHPEKMKEYYTRKELKKKQRAQESISE